MAGAAQAPQKCEPSWYTDAFAPISEPGEENYSNSYVKKVLRKVLKAFPVFLGKGVFILYYNTRTSWGPIKFGFCGPTIEKIELFGKKIKH